MASSGASIRFEGELFASLAQLKAKNMAAIVASGRKIEQEGVSHMRSNAPWTDQTGNARNGLSGATKVGASDVAVVFYHQVPYGIWLEVANSGRYQIILPTVQLMGPRWFTLIKAMLFKGG